jgi:N-formylglutamate amidohydrolase
MKQQTLPGIYTLARAAQPLPLVIDSPHSGRSYPADFRHACPRAELERAEDNHVDDLVARAPAYGAALLCALFPRSYIDVNRAPGDIDPAIVAGRWPEETAPSHLSQIGYGLVRRLVRPGMPVYDRALEAAEIRARIDTYYNPYHDALAALIDEAVYNFGAAWHLNVHSMPAHGRTARRGGRVVGAGQADFVLGDRDGTSCAREYTLAVRDILTGMGYGVALNNPYKGVEIVRRHGRPHHGRHSLQVEINKALYWDEQKNIKTHNYNALKRDIEFLVAQVAAYVAGNLHRVAAD